MEAVWDVVREFFFSEKYSFFRNAAAIFGTFVVGRFVLRHLCNMVSGFRAFFLAPMGLGRMNLRKYGSWAVVTGASDGIGRGYSLELAKQGLNVALISRTQEKLNKVADEIKEQYGRETRVISVDFSSGGLDIYTMINDQLKDMDVGILVNNVGYISPVPNIVDQMSAEVMDKTIQINCQPIVQMSRLLLPKMVERGGGIVVNISSAASVQALPQLTVYIATKAFTNYISDGIRKEYGSKGILVQNVVPCVVATTLTRVKPNVFAPSPTSFARAAVATIGIQENTYGCFSHAVQGHIIRNAGRLLDKMTNAASNSDRERYLKEQAEKKQQ